MIIDRQYSTATDVDGSNKEIIRLLIGHGANIGAKNIVGEIPRISTAEYREMFNGRISMVEGESKNIFEFKPILW